MSTIILLVILILVGCGKKIDNKEENIVKEKHESVVATSLTEEVKIEGLKFKHEEAVLQNGEMHFYSILTNTTNKDKDVEFIKGTVTFLDENGEEKLVDLLFYFGGTIHKGETTTTTTIIPLDLTTTSKIVYEFSKG